MKMYRMKQRLVQVTQAFLAEVNDLAKLNKSYGEQLATQMENEPLRKIPKLSDNKKFLGHLRATRLLIYKN